jgi:hypothetical protein
MKTTLLAWMCGALALASLAVEPATAQTRVGGGIHYLRTVGDIKDVPEFDANAVGFMASATRSFPLLRLEGDIEWIPDFGGTSKSMIQPQAWALLGNFFYGGVGVGIGRFNGDWQDNPFYAIRVGVGLDVLGLDLDGFASYRFQNSKVLESFDKQDLDAVTLGALVRFTLD